jgi:hypothetical protein
VNGETRAGEEWREAGAAGTGGAAPASEVYAYKPSLMGAPWELRAAEDALEWRSGRASGRIPYGDITAVRLSYRPLTLQSRRFVCEIRRRRGPRLTVPSTSWEGLLLPAPQDAPYGAFVRALHRRLAAASQACAEGEGGGSGADGGSAGGGEAGEGGARSGGGGAGPVLLAGSPSFLYWPGVAILAAVAMTLLVLALRALASGDIGGAALVAAFLAVLLWQTGVFFLRNRPRRYRAAALPADLVPGGE